VLGLQGGHGSSPVLEPLCAGFDQAIFNIASVTRSKPFCVDRPTSSSIGCGGS
jgi:hypothetical protein